MRCFVLSCIFIAKVFAFSSAIMPGMHALDFTLQNTLGQDVSLHDYAGKIIVLEWQDPRCNYVKKYYNSNKMQSLQKHYKEQFGVVWLSIILNNEETLPSAATHQLLDPAREVTHLYDVQKAPEVIIVDEAGYIAYVGAIDSVRSHEIADVARARANYIEMTLDALLSAYPVPISHTRPFGCQTTSFTPDQFQQV